MTSQFLPELKKTRQELREHMLREGVLDGHSWEKIARDVKQLLSVVMAQRAEGVETPRFCCILPPWSFHQEKGLSPAEQNPLNWMHRLKEWQAGNRMEGKGLIMKETRLFLVCARTYRLVPCGPKGQGYVIQQLRAIIRGVGSLWSVMLRLTCGTLGAVALADISSTALEGALGTALDLAEEGAVSALKMHLYQVAVRGEEDLLDEQAGASSWQEVRT